MERMRLMIERIGYAIEPNGYRFERIVLTQRPGSRLPGRLMS